MKFTDGFWLVRQGVDVAYARSVWDVESGADTFTAHAPTIPGTTGRGDTLKGPVLDVTVTTPAPGVIGVEVTHFSGAADRGPHFDVRRAAPEAWAGAPVRVERTADNVTLTSGSLSATLGLNGGFDLSFSTAGRRLTACGHKSLAVATTSPVTEPHRDLGAPEGYRSEAYTLAQLDLGVGTNVYGLGERFTPFVKNGQTVDVWNADGGTSSEQAYKSIPFYVTDAGYGVFVDHPGHVSFEVGTETVSRVQFSVPGQTVRFYVVEGATPAAVLERYTALTGRPSLPPAWSFGTWLSTSFTTDYDEATVSSFIDGMAERGLPLSVFHFDCFWMREWRWCDFEWDPRSFPDPEGMLARLKARDLKICVWINPYIAQRSPLFAEGRDKGYLVHRPDGSVWQWDLWQPGMALVDFTNPEAREWYAAHLRRLLGQGVDAFKTDFGERIPTDVVWHDGSDPQRMHNYYTQLYNETVVETLREFHGSDQVTVFARSATAGGQQFPVHWGGDNSSTFPSMAETLRGGLSLVMSGFGFWSHDIGGFEGTPDPAVFKRWVPFGLLGSHSRFHGSQSYRVPWAFDDEAVDVVRVMTHAKYRLMPSLYAAAVQAHEVGTPVMRPMVLAFPHDPTAAYLDRQYLLGPDVLVAPVFSAEGDVRFYLPEGVWTDLFSGERVQGGRWVDQKHGFTSVPMLVRPGAVLPVGARVDRPDYDYTQGVTLAVHEPVDGATVEVVVPDLTGEPAARFTVKRDGCTVHATLVEGSAEGWQVLLVGAGSAEPADGATAEAGTLPGFAQVTGVRLTPAAGARAVSARVADLV